MDRQTLLLDECERILDWSADDLRTLRGSRLLVSGGAGFIGRWMLASFLHANRRLGLQAQAVGLSRNPGRLAQDAPWLLGDPALEWHTGDLRCSIPSDPLTHVIHAAAPTNSTNRDRPMEAIDTVVGGTRNLLDAACTRQAQAFLMLSTGAIYGPQPSGMAAVPEDHQGGPDPLDPAMVTPEAKRLAEQICVHYGRRPGAPRTTIARIFTIIGPDLPDEGRYAVDQFLDAAAAGAPVVVQGDGTAERSYLYIADLVSWLWALLARGQHLRTYNVGGAEGGTIREWAGRVAAGRCQVVVHGLPTPGAAPHRYVPDVGRIGRELGVRAWTGFDEAVARCLAWRSCLPEGAPAPR